METGFYEVQTFSGRDDFISQARSYAYDFNAARKNSGKENMTPRQLVQDKIENPPPEMLLFNVLFLDEEYQRVLHNNSPGRYHVGALPSVKGLWPTFGKNHRVRWRVLSSSKHVRYLFSVRR